MTRPRVAIVGCDGYLGSFLMRALSIDFHTYGINRRDSAPEELNRSINRDADVVINCAKFGSIDDYERHVAQASRSMVSTALGIVDLCRTFNCHLIQISTNYVFGGTKPIYTEEDAPDPINNFGIVSKHVEESVSEYDDSLTLRTSAIYGCNSARHSWDLWFLRQMAERKPVTGWSNDYTTPTFVYDIARVIRYAIVNRLTGLYHLSGQDSMSRYDFFRQLLEVIAFDQIECNTESLLLPGECVEEHRPRMVCLSSAKLLRDTDIATSGVMRGLNTSEYRQSCLRHSLWVRQSAELI